MSPLQWLAIFGIVSIAFCIVRVMMYVQELYLLKLRNDRVDRIPLVNYLIITVARGNGLTFKEYQFGLPIGNYTETTKMGVISSYLFNRTILMNYFTIKVPLFFQYFNDQLCYLKFFTNNASEISDTWYVIIRRQEMSSHSAMLLELF